MQLQARDKRALIGGAAVALASLAYLLWPSGTPDSAVQLVPAEERGSAAPASVTPPPAQPAAPAVTAAAGPTAPAQVPAAPPGVVPEGLKLTGVTATGAIFAFPDGSQRLVQRGRPVAPGLVLQTVRVNEVLLSSNGATLRLTFSGPAGPVQPPAAPATPSPPLDRSLFR